MIRPARSRRKSGWRAPFWRPPGGRASPVPAIRLHVVIGPAGSGKTTCLCKWLTQAALVEGRLARVWRLDGATANMAESLTVYCEILHLPMRTRLGSRRQSNCRGHRFH